VRSAACKLIAKRVFGICEIIAIAVKSVKLFMIYYTSCGRMRYLLMSHVEVFAHNS
jgi:hypothetical protein